MKPAEEVIGAVGLTVMTVRAGDTSVAMGIGDLPIVSQSQLISLMEHAAIISMDEHLEPEETRAIFKNVRVDLRMYKHLKLFLHAEGVQTRPQVQNDELKAIIRIGSDLNDNYYQIEKLLTTKNISIDYTSEELKVEISLPYNQFLTFILSMHLL